VTLPSQLDAAALLKEALAQKVAFVPGAPFFPNGGGHNTFRLNFSNATPERIREGIARLGGVLKAALGQRVREYELAAR
jgi:2-aminoadipate transaminase